MRRGTPVFRDDRRVLPNPPGPTGRANCVPCPWLATSREILRVYANKRRSGRFGVVTVPIHAVTPVRRFASATGTVVGGSVAPDAAVPLAVQPACNDHLNGRLNRRPPCPTRTCSP